MGVIGLYVNIIFLEVKRRPNYIIDSIIRSADSKPVASAVNVEQPR
jgi:hypothetical protein